MNAAAQGNVRHINADGEIAIRTNAERHRITENNRIGRNGNRRAAAEGQWMIGPFDDLRTFTLHGQMHCADLHTLLTEDIRQPHANRLAPNAHMNDFAQRLI